MTSAAPAAESPTAPLSSTLLERRDELYRRLQAKADRRLQLAERGDGAEAEGLGRELDALAKLLRREGEHVFDGF